MTALEKAALNWWLTKRPLTYTEDEHINIPAINCRNEAEEELAWQVSRMLEKKK